MVHDDGTATFRVWAPQAERVELVTDNETHALHPLPRGWWTRRAAAQHGTRYGFTLDGGDVLPDPASRWQPDGVHARSAVVDPQRFSWSETEGAWRAPPLAGAVFYELHVGAFTPAGTLASAAERLGPLADLGVTHIEVMPVGAFNGPRGWGYDGVAWYAVHEPYGGPEAFAAFVDACHRHGLAVVLDVVYNHMGPSGNYLPRYGPYLTDRYDTPWGEAVNLDGPGSDAVRGFIIGSALGWLADYHVDGLRLDAVHGFVDTSATHILAQLSEAVADLAGRLRRPLQLIAESDRQDPQTVRPREVGGAGLDGQWLDDLHHGIHVAVTGERDGYYGDYAGLPDVAAAYVRGLVYDGRYSPSRDRTVGAPLGLDVPSHRLIACIQNHDQVGNRAAGDRLTTLVDEELVRLAIVLLLAAPTTPLLFMGEEYGETNPFRYFTSHPEPDLAGAVRQGRRAEFAAFESFGAQVPDPQDAATFAASKLDWSKADSAEGGRRRALWQDLLRLRRDVPALGSGDRRLTECLHVDETVLVVRRRHAEGRSVVLAANVSAESAECPLGRPVELMVSSDDARYGGAGATVKTADAAVVVPARTACLLEEVPRETTDRVGRLP